MPEITGQIRMIFQNAEEKKIPARLTLKGSDGYFNTFEKAKVKDLKIGDEVKIEYTVKTTAKGTLNNIDSIEAIRKKDISNQIDLNKLPDKERVKDKQAIIGNGPPLPTWPETKISSEELNEAKNGSINKNMGGIAPLVNTDFIPANLLKSDPKSEHIDNAVILKEIASTYIEEMDPKSEEDFEFLAKKFRRFLNTGSWL